MSNVIAFRLPGTPSPNSPAGYIPATPGNGADPIPFVGKPATPAVPQHEMTRRVNRILRLANSWGVGHLLMRVGPGGAA